MNKIALPFFIAISLFFLSACKKDKKLPLVTTSSVQPGLVTARVAGVLYEEGGSGVTEKGICWGEHGDLSISNNKVICTDQGTTFAAEISGLEDEKTYFARAYAINSLGVSYGKEISFKTQSSVLPGITLSFPSFSQPGPTSATLRIDLNQQVRATYTIGICWSTGLMPTTSDNTLISDQITQSNPVPFSYIYNSTLHNLSESTVYYARAYSTNGLTTRYSNQVTFTTQHFLDISALNSLGFTNASVTSTISAISSGTITAVGVCWSTNPLPTITDSKSEQSYSGTSFTRTLSPLNANTTYYIRAYVKTTSTTYYSPQKKINTYKSTVTDIDGNAYNTVQIGNQEWMTGNLRTTHYNTGATIQLVANYNQWVNLANAQSPEYCYYNYQATYNATYGKLYPQYVAFDPDIAPVGWHVATLSEWQTLFVNYSAADLWKGGTGFDGNYTGLSLLAGGLWDSGFMGLTQTGYYWAPPSFTQDNSIIIDVSSALPHWYSNGNGLSIRCIKD